MLACIQKVEKTENIYKRKVDHIHRHIWNLCWPVRWLRSSQTRALLILCNFSSPPHQPEQLMSQRSDFVTCFVMAISKGYAPLFHRPSWKERSFLEHSFGHWLFQFKNLWKYDWGLREDSECCSLKKDFESLGCLQIWQCLGTSQDEQYMNPCILLFMPTSPSCYRVLLI